MKKNIVLFIVLAVMSCKNKSVEECGLASIDIDSLASEIPAIKNLVYIPLETTELSLIGDINKVLYRNHMFFIFDKLAKKVFVFDDKGVFLYAINHLGEGSGEYVLPADMDVDELGNVYISDYSTKRIIRYNAGGSHDFQVIKIDDYFFDFAVFDQKTIFLGDVVRDGKFSINLAKYDTKTGKVLILDETDIGIRKLITRCSAHYFFRSGNTLNYYKRFYPFIFSLGDKDIISKRVEIKSERLPSAGIISKWEKAGSKMSILTDEKYIHDVSSFYEIDDYFFVTFQAIPLGYSLINKHGGEVYNFTSFSSLIKDLNSFSGIFASDGHSFVSYCYPTIENVHNILKSNSAMTEETKKRMYNLAEDSNPIMIVFDFNRALR